MTVVTYPLGRPRAATARGGDCRARDLDRQRNVFGLHSFAATDDCQISNGLLRVTVGASGTAPTVTIEAYRGAVTIGDYLSDILSDTLGGSMSTPAWQAMGTVTIDAPSLSALLTAVHIVRLSPEAVTLRLVAPIMADAYVTLRRGERMVRIQHGSSRVPLVDTDRRIRWTATPSPTGTASAGRVEELLPTIEGFPRFVAGRDTATANAGAFSLTAASVVSASVGAGVGTWADYDRPPDLHGQLASIARGGIRIGAGPQIEPEDYGSYGGGY